MPLGNADEQKPAKEGTVEAWARSADNPVGGWYGLKKGLRGRFGNYVPPVLEVLGSGRGRAPAPQQSDARDLALRTSLKRVAARERPKAVPGPPMNLPPTCVVSTTVAVRCGRSFGNRARIDGSSPAARGADVDGDRVVAVAVAAVPEPLADERVDHEGRVGRVEHEVPRPGVVVERTRRVADEPGHVAGERPGARLDAVREVGLAVDQPDRSGIHHQPDEVAVVVAVVGEVQKRRTHRRSATDRSKTQTSPPGRQLHGQEVGLELLVREHAVRAGVDQDVDLERLRALCTPQVCTPISTGSVGSSSSVRNSSHVDVGERVVHARREPLGRRRRSWRP